MGNSSSAPVFSHESQLLGDHSAPQSVEVPDPNKPANASNPRRNAKLPKGELLVTPFQVDTIWKCFLHGSQKYPDNRCFGTRTWERDPSNADKYLIGSDKIVVRGEYVWDSYAAVELMAKQFGAGLVSLGFKRDTNVGIFSSNRQEWMLTALGAWSQSMRIVSLYASLGENAVEYIINHADVPVVLVSKQNIKALFKSLPNMKNVTHIIQFDQVERWGNVEESVSAEDVAKAKEHNITLLGFWDVHKMGADAGAEVVLDEPKPDDVAYIMYTSGTTGDPKGAILLHRNIAATVAAALFAFPLNQEDAYLSYLPLAHIFETVAMMSMLAVGARVGFFQDNLKKLTADLQGVQPTLLCGVPRVFQRIYSVVMAGVSEKNCIVRWYFNKAFNAQLDCRRAGQPVHPKYDAKVFAPLRERIGLNKVRIIVSGAAPLPPYLDEFLRVVTGSCAVMQGYGMTEGSAATAVAGMDDPNVGHCGPPVCCSEIRLEDIPDMGYLHTDPHPRGELCIRAGNVFAGYYKDEENTKATIIDGWLHTGDVARINPNGTLSIIDRKKNMFKLSQGEYIAAEKIEQVYAKSPAVGQIWVYGNSFKSFLLAVVVPAAEPLAQYAHSKGWWPQSDKETARLASDSFLDDFATLMNGPHAAELKAWVVSSLREQEKGLKGFERVKDFLIEPKIDRMGSGFTEQNDCLTPTFKLKRPQLLKAYIKDLKNMYAQHGEADNAGEKWPGEP